MSALLLMFILVMMGILIKYNNDYQRKLEEQQLAQEKIIAQNEELERQSEEMKQQQKVLEEQENKINQLIGIKSQIIEELSESFKNTDLVVTIDSKTGSIAFASSVLFDYNDDTIKDSGFEFLDQFLPIYFNTIFSDEFKPYISEIIIEGYTDNVGSYIYNLELSQKRAFSVSKYCLENPNLLSSTENFTYLQSILTTNGKSMSNLIYDDDGNVDSESSRRVEFKFRLKDDEMITELKSILENS
jgi:chemotaxis protein MotB